MIPVTLLRFVSRTACLSALCLLCAVPLAAQTLTSSDLPIVLIETDEAIPDEPKIVGRMRVIDNADGRRNQITDPPTGYDGFIGIEVRGATSQLFPKQQYALETRDARGDNRNVPLLGMPSENDWVLHAPYTDKTLVRNAVAYRLARAMGRYASRTRFCEVVVNGEYQGVYLLLEAIKRDSERVDIARLRPSETSGDDLTGGYIVKVDKFAGGQVGGWFSPLPPPYPFGRQIRWEFHEPSPRDIVPEQAAYIERTITAFEHTLASDDIDDPARGFLPLIDLGSFVDFVILNEVTKNIDGYRASTYLHKDKDSNGGLLRAGPVWDFNLAMGNASFGGGADHRGFQFDWNDRGDGVPIPFWWGRMARSAPFQAAMRARWAELRAGPLAPEAIEAVIDGAVAETAEARVRDAERWGTEGEYVWGNAYVGETHAEDVRYLQAFTRRRAAWMDGALAQPLAPGPGPAVALSRVWPSPASGDVQFTVTTGAADRLRLEIVDARGRRVQTIFEGAVEAGRRTMSVSTAGLAAGAYFVVASGSLGTFSRPLVIVRR